MLLKSGKNGPSSTNGIYIYNIFHTNAELEEMAVKSPEEQGAERVEAAKVKERQTVMNTKVPTHGTWRKNERENEDVTFMGVM